MHSRTSPHTCHSSDPENSRNALSTLTPRQHRNSVCVGGGGLSPRATSLVGKWEWDRNLSAHKQGATREMIRGLYLPVCL